MEIKSIWLNGAELFDSVLDYGIEVEVADHRGIFSVYLLIAHLPDGQRPTMEERLKAYFLILEV